LDPIDGDRIGESLLRGHTLPEVLTLVTEMCSLWDEGCRLLHTVSADDADMRRQNNIADCIRILFDGARNILEFYLLRDRLGRREGNAEELLSRMEQLVHNEIANSRNMIPLCNADGTLGYHSEGEGYKFFPEKLLDRIAHLETLLCEEFTQVRMRLQKGIAPLAYYLGETDGVKYHLTSDIGCAKWESVGEVGAFRAAVDGRDLLLELTSETAQSFTICPEYQLFSPDVPVTIGKDGTLTLRDESDAKLYHSVFGDKISAELSKYAAVTAIPGGWQVRIDLQSCGLEVLRPFKLRILMDDISWIPEPDPFTTLGLHYVKPEEYGWFLPPVEKK